MPFTLCIRKVKEPSYFRRGIWALSFKVSSLIRYLIYVNTLEIEGEREAMQANSAVAIEAYQLGSNQLVRIDAIVLGSD